jgi:uncharacterized membrane protein YtjA (UPF0391 family)
MLRVAVLFLLVALLAGILHLGGVATAFADIAWMVIVASLAICMLSVMLNYTWLRPGPHV